MTQQDVHRHGNDTLNNATQASKRDLASVNHSDTIPTVRDKNSKMLFE